MRRAILAGNQKTPTSSRKRRDQRHSLSAQVRRLRLEQLVAREMLSADGFTLATMTSNTDIFDPAILEGDVVVKTKAPNGGEVTPAVPIEVDQWLMVWNPDQGPGASYGPSVVTSIEANDLIENSHVIKFQQAFTADQAVEHLGLGGTPEMTYPLIATNLAERLIPTDPDFFMQFHLRNTGQYGGAGGQDINVVNAWDSYLGDGVVIGVVDDGVDYNHPDLLGNYRADLSFDYAFGDSDPAPDTSVNWHGTAVAGVAAALHNNAVFGRGTTGVAPQADIAGIRLTAAATTDATNAAAINHQMGDVDIYVNSWGPLDIGNIAAAGQPGPLARAALENGAQNGRGGLGSVLIWAAGNGHASSDNVNYDLYANSRHTIAVGAMTHTGVETNYSERGSALFVVAPSTGAGTALAVATTDIFGPLGYTTANFTDPSETTTTRFTGTSAAAPQVAGVVALMLEANPSLTARDVQHILAESARRNDTGDADWFQNAAGHWVNPKFGFGVVDATAATTLAETWTPVSDELAWNSTVLEPALSIPDNDLTGTNVTFGVPDNFQVEHVEVQIDADHTYGGDLVITLTSPNGTASRLTEVHNQVGTYTFDHTLTTNRNWNEDTFGDWTLTVADGFAADTGTLERAAIKVYGHVIDTALPNLTSTNVTANEADGTIDFEIMLEAAQAEDVTFEAVTFDGTAIDGSDYTGLDFEPFTIPAGETSIVISVPLIQDGVEEIAKTFSLGLTNFVGSDPLVRAAVGTIVDDDDPPFYVATPQTMISPIAAMIAESNGNEILLISDTDVDDMRFEAVDGTLASALVTPANEDVTITAQFVDPNGDPIGSSVSSASPGAAVVLPLTAMAGNGAHAVRVIGDTSSDVVIDLMFGAVNEGFGDDTGGGSSAMLEGSLISNTSMPRLAIELRTFHRR